jgi:protein-S-isoprenylcysteine O-methyltransferase Ste14
MNKSKAFLGGATILYFIIGFEILIMISPFAAFFYAAFNPFLLFLAQYRVTHWLTAFFLPHMVLPPGVFLKVIRIAGSVLFVVGGVIFLVCAGQVYFNKFFKKGVALRGLYTYIRHPQYLGLELTGLGLSILWPRFLVIVLWLVMVALYYFLSRDEERRMARQFGVDYQQYRDRTGMFLPRGLEGLFLKKVIPGIPWLRTTLMFVLLVFFTLGGSLALRAYTIHHLHLWTNGPVTALAILPNDLSKLEHRMGSVLEIPEIKNHLTDGSGPFLVYFMPPAYLMQGMIAYTGGEWQLYKHHHTFAMIADWIFHPFRHLEGGPMGLHHNSGHSMGISGSGNGMVMRMIFLRIETGKNPSNRFDLFGINARRVPLFVADVEIHNLILLKIQDLAPETGWGRVPTPIF